MFLINLNLYFIFYVFKSSLVSNADERDSEACGAPVWNGAILQFSFVLNKLA